MFRRTREDAEQLAAQLEASGLPVSLLHGERRQRERERALEAFTRGEVQALVATDIAARGLDVEDVRCVVHYDFPEDSKSFQHRSGRTARAGLRGQVICLVAPEEEARARRLSKQLALGAVLRVPRVEKLGSPRRA